MSLPLVIVGPGRLGRSIARLLSERDRAFELVGRGEPIPAAQVTWLTVADKDIATASSAVPQGGVVLHASGALEHSVLRPHTCVGSLHPLMSFPGPEIGMPQTDIPAAVAGDEDAIAAAIQLADDLGFLAVKVPGDRTLYHAAAVTAGNFATVLLIEASRMLAAAGVPEADARALLGPLAITSIKNAIDHGTESLTGPVARGDEGVIASHHEALGKLSPELSALYAALCDATRSIAK